ncbi:TIM barrel protein, partial [Candidatus Pacearchaeota archaeon]|nr:TIM barrel protein [Candidatus Pacearchaeota archaeon]
MVKIFIGPAGTGGADLSNFSKLKELGLDAVEIEFTYSVWMSKEQALKIREANKELGLKLSIHAPYFINLNSEEPKKIGASRARILKCCEIGHYLSDEKHKVPIVFHPGFYLKKSKQECFKIIVEQIKKIQLEIDKNKWNVILAPETTGKPSQFGDLDELLQISSEVGCGICVDFAHLKARYNGNINYSEIMEKIKKSSLKKIHAHFSGIEFTAKGERKHLVTQEKDIKELFTYLKKLDIE